MVRLLQYLIKIVLLLFLFTRSLAQTPPEPVEVLRFKYFGLDEGLPDQKVWDIYQDRSGFLWFVTRGNLVRYDGYEMTALRPADSLLKAVSPWGVKVMLKTESHVREDANGDLWMNIPNGFLKWERNTEKFTSYIPLQADSTVLIQGETAGLHVDSRGRLWSSSPKQGLLCATPISPGKMEVEFFTIPGMPDYCFDWVKEIFPGDGGKLWFTSDCGLGLLDPAVAKISVFLPVPDSLGHQRNILRAAATGPDGQIYLGAESGELLAFDPVSEKFSILSHRPEGQRRNFINALCYEGTGRLWVGWFRGRKNSRHLFDLQSRRFLPVDPHFVNYDAGTYGLAGTEAILQDHSGVIWWATQNAGLFKFDPSFNRFKELYLQPDRGKAVDYKNVYELHCDQLNRTWLATPDGFYMISADRQKIRHFPYRPENYIKDPNPNEFLIIEIEPGEIWLITPGDIRRFDAATQQLVPTTLHCGEIDFNTQILRDIIRDRDGNLWISGWEGLFFLDQKTGDCRHYTVADGLKNNSLYGLFPDSKGNIWITTGTHGTYRFDVQNQTFHQVLGDPFSRDLDPNLWAAYNRQALVDDHNRIWAGTTKGLRCFQPGVDSFKNYTVEDGLPANLMTWDAAKNGKGEMFFSTQKGVLYFHPDSIRENTTPPKLAFTAFDFFEKRSGPDEQKATKIPVAAAPNIKLDHYQNDLTIRFAALHFKNPDKNRYRVRLTPYDAQWRDIGYQRFMTYTNLDPGRYTFEVIAANSDGIWSKEPIRMAIRIRPPWYWNVWSKTIYLILIAMLVLGIYRFQLNRSLALAEAGRLRELDAVKTRLYTNITHEFRTPLTVIQGTTEQIDRHEKEKEIILRNSENLLGMVNRLLDLSKLEAGKLELHLIQDDILAFLRYVTESFHSLALQQKINLNFYAHQDKIEMDYDPDKILQVLSNLIANALKFTPEYGKVTIIARRDSINGHPWLILEVKDTGIGIGADQLPHIFDRFYQGDDADTRRAEGTGIGLALVRELVELMDGTIQVKSELRQGSSFTVQLPINNQARKMETPPALSWTEAPLAARIPVEDGRPAEPVRFSEAPILLIVEDNHDVRRYLNACLHQDYQLLFATNGREGIDQALEHIPDIIISDVMMPEVDGFELCRTLKQDDYTSHIPIILLTAKADTESKLEGLEYGADAYLVKPFHRSELEVRLRKLLELRSLLQAKYNQAGFDPEPATRREDEFILKLRQEVLDHLEDSDFGVEHLSSAMYMHRSQLHRKIKALTGNPTTHFIRKVRLQEAYRLLKEGGRPVKEVAYTVGFSDPAYFSKLFAEEYGRPPSKA